MLRIFTTKSFMFTKGEEKVKVKNQDFADVPKWVANTDLFKMAERDGSVQIMESKKKQITAENTGKIEKEAPSKK